MKVLVIDTASIVATAAIMDDEKLIAETIVNYKKKHSEKLLPAIDHLLTDVGMDISDIDVYGIVKGPGSFTGLRIGMATIKGFAQAQNKPVVGISSLEALAYNIAYTDGIICPILDAQRNQVYTGVYQSSPDGLQTIVADSVMSIDALIEGLAKTVKGSVYVLGDGVPKYFETMEKSLPNAVRVKPYLAMNRASSAAQLAIEKAKAGKLEDYKTIAPMYIRPSYAEENHK